MRPLGATALLALAVAASAQDCLPQARHAHDAVQCVFGPNDPAAPFTVAPLPHHEPELAGIAAFHRLDLPGTSVVVMHFLHHDFRDPLALARMTGRAFAVLPPPVLAAMPGNLAFVWQRPVRPDAETDSDPFVSLMSFDPRLVLEDEGRLAHAVEELLLREIGHALDAVWGASSRPSWLAAVERDAGHASGLARTDSAADFAETFTVWAAYRRDLARPSVERRMTAEQRRNIHRAVRYRLAWLDRELMAAAVVPGGRLLTTR